jgi:two-component system phosphate regulon response regulator PhoB
VSRGTILVIEDEKDIRELIEHHLRREGYTVVSVATGEAGLEAVERQRPALVLLDLMLPGLDGFEVCKHLKNSEATRDIPIVMLTARSEETDIVSGLELGADDYVRKPFSMKELIARIRARLRRSESSLHADDRATIRTSRVYIDPSRHVVKVDDSLVSLTPTEFRILALLAKHPGWVFSRDQIINAVRGEDAVVTDRSVDVQIVGLRKKLGSCGDSVETVRGVGYRFNDTLT